MTNYPYLRLESESAAERYPSLFAPIDRQTKEEIDFSMLSEKIANRIFSELSLKDLSSFGSTKNKNYLFAKRKASDLSEKKLKGLFSQIAEKLTREKYPDIYDSLVFTVLLKERKVYSFHHLRHAIEFATRFLIDFLSDHIAPEDLQELSQHCIDRKDITPNLLKLALALQEMKIAAEFVPFYKDENLDIGGGFLNALVNYGVSDASLILNCLLRKCDRILRVQECFANFILEGEPVATYGFPNFIIHRLLSQKWSEKFPKDLLDGIFTFLSFFQMTKELQTLESKINFPDVPSLYRPPAS